MRRRAFLATGLTAVTAGCLSGDGDDGPAPAAGDSGTDDGSSDDGTGDDGPDDGSTVTGSDLPLPGAAPDASATTAGLAPEPEEMDVRGVNVDSLPTYDHYEASVPLLPVDLAHEWYRSGDARIVDARPESSFQNSRVPGAVSSPAPDARRGALPDDDPVAAWDADERILTYCTCPHHLSGQRASELRSEGYTAVFAIDEGFGEWTRRDYPTASGEDGQALAAERTIRGRVDPAHAGEFVYVRDPHGDQVEPAIVDDDGSFTIHFRFPDLQPDDELTVQTPDWEHTAPVADLTDGEVRSRA